MLHFAFTQDCHCNIRSYTMFQFPQGGVENGSGVDRRRQRQPLNTGFHHRNAPFPSLSDNVLLAYTQGSTGCFQIIKRTT